MPRKLLLSGYYGCGNLGDDAMLLGLLAGIGSLDVEPIVLSGAPEETSRLYGVRSVPRKEMRMVDEAIQGCDALIFGGGSIFQDVSSVRSVAYYAQLVKTAKKHGKKVLLLAQGVGPLNRFLGKRMATGAFNMADIVTVRDSQSSATLRALGYRGTPRLTGDLAFLMPQTSADEGSAGFAVGDMKTIGLAPRPFKGADVVALFAELSRVIFQANLMPVLIEMDRNEDGPLIAEIDKRQGGKIPSIRRLQTPMQAQGRMARMEAIIAMRLHAGVLATKAGIPPYMLSYDPKVTAFAQSMELPAATSLNGMTASRAFEGLSAMLRDRERILRTMERKREEAEAAARLNIDILREALGL